GIALLQAPLAPPGAEDPQPRVRRISAIALDGADLEQQANLPEESAIGCRKRGVGIPDVDGLAAAAVEFDHAESLAALQLRERGKPHVEAAEVEGRDGLGERVDPAGERRGDQIDTVAEDRALAVI